MLDLLRRFPFIALIAIVGVGGYVFRDHLTGDVHDLRVGDCFDEPAAFATSEDAEVSEVQHRPCADPHDGEVFILVTHSAGTDAAYPREEVMEDFVEENCLPAFHGYVGRSFAVATEFGVGWFYPSLESWQGGDRVFTCYVYNVDGSQLVRSVKVPAP